MKKALLIGRSDQNTKEVENAVLNLCNVVCCPDNEETIEGMVYSEQPDIIIVSFSGSAIAARDTFRFLLPLGIPILGIGNPAHEAELVINGILSEPGTRFLTKPAKPEAFIKCMNELGIVDNAPDDKNKRDKVILVVDDNPVFLRTHSSMLSKKYKVVLAASAVRAIIAIGRRKPDLILLDYEMPLCDGKMMLEMLRAEKDLKNIPVIFLTGLSDAKHVSSVVELHPQGYLLKPCSEDMLFEMVDRILASG